MDIKINQNKNNTHTRQYMSKYNITIKTINLTGQSHEATGTIMKAGEEIEFQAETIWWSGTRRWKVKEDGQLAVKVSSSKFDQGERMAIARWLGEVSKNQELIGKSSGQGTGAPRQQQTNVQVEELQAQNQQLSTQLKELQDLMAGFIAMQNASAAEDELDEGGEEVSKPSRKSRK